MENDQTGAVPSEGLSRPAAAEHPRTTGDFTPASPPAQVGELAGIAPGAIVAELVGTFLFVWMGTATVLATNQLHTGAPAHLVAAQIAISVAFGLGLMVAVYATGAISGAHLNPAITLALASMRRFPWRAAPFYWAAQFAGATLAGLANWYLFGGGARHTLLLGATQPGPRGVGPALVAEALLTGLLAVTIMATAVDTERSAGPTAAGLAIGLVVAAGIFAMLPVSGGSFNPARTLGPMIAAWSFHDWWVYFAGPIAGALIGTGLYELVLSQGRMPT